jgi:ABC-type dipeptide/oligopeptide/nickel transport system permease subunit
VAAYLLTDPRALRRFRKNKGAMAGLVLVALVTVIALMGPLLSFLRGHEVTSIGPIRVPHDPSAQFRDVLLDRSSGLPAGPGAIDGFALGADSMGRDELARLLDGGAVSMQVAFFATGLAVLLGLFVGVTSGYFGKVVDTVSMRSVDVLQSLPFLLVAMAVKRVIDRPELWTLYLLLGFLSWTTLARVTRAKTMQVRELEFVQAARALGMSEARILLRHVLPNVLGPAIVIGTTLVAQMIIAESAMSFLGLGVEAPQASWGSMLAEGQQYLSHAPRLVLFPGLLIMMTVFGFNLLGEGLRDAIDPKD